MPEDAVLKEGRAALRKPVKATQKTIRLCGSRSRRSGDTLANQSNVSRHFVMIWASLAILLSFFAIPYALTSSNPFYGDVDWAIIGFMAGLMGGRQGN